MLKKIAYIICVCGLAQSCFAQSIQSKSSSANNGTGFIDSLLLKGRHYYMRAKPDSAKLFFENALQFAKREKGTATQFVDIYVMMSRVSYMKKNLAKALSTIRLANPFIKNAIATPVLGNYYYFTATYFRSLLQYDSSLFYYHKVEKLNEVNNPYGNWYIYDGIATLFLAGESYAKAEEYYLKAYELTKKAGIRMDYGLMLNRLGNLYTIENNAEKLAKIIKEYEEFKSKRSPAIDKDPLHNLLFINWGNKSLKEKVALLQNAKKYHIKNGYYSAAMLANYQIAQVYEANDQAEEALKYLYENRNFFIEKNSIAKRYPNLQYIYQLEKKAGKTADAILTANQLLELTTQLTSESNKKLAYELEKKYETKKKEKEIELLNSQNELNELELLRAGDMRKALERENLLKDETISQQQELALISQREKEWQQKELEKEKLLSISLSNENKLNEQLIEKDKNKKRNLLIGIGLLTLAGISILYLYRKQVVKNRIINKQREDLVMLNREIHHRVKNNLQIISSLLDLQSATINDEPTAEKFREGSQRVQSMAYIHQNLYQGESPGIVDMKEYISILADNLMQSFNTEGSNIQLQTSVDNVQLHSDMVISLGLIINELVSNAFKYAFQNKQAGQIDIVLKKEENHLLLQVKDNGVGMSKKPEPDKENSFGYKVIRAFTQKLKATISIQHKKGTDVRILIPHYRMA